VAVDERHVVPDNNGRLWLAFDDRIENAAAVTHDSMPEKAMLDFSVDT
jgi:hypothetical protein